MTPDRLQEIKDRIQQIGFVRAGKDPDASEEVARLYKEVFGKKVCSTCRSKLGNAFSEILNANIETIMKTTDRRYNFKKKNILKRFVNPIPGVPELLNNSNLEDKHVELIIAARPEAAEWFTDSQSEGKPLKAVKPEAPPPSALEIRMEEIDSLMSAGDIKKELKERNIAFAASATKKVLVKLLAEAPEKKPAE